jgi:hypothetical protein
MSRSRAARTIFAAVAAAAASAGLVTTGPPVSAAPVGPPAHRGKVAGTFIEVHGDAKPSDQTLYYLKLSGRYYRLKLKREPRIRSQASVSVSGSISGNTVDATAGSITATSAPQPVAATGAKDLLVINIAWPSAGLTATVAQEQNFLFGTDWRSVASYYSAASYGQMTWTGTETPTYQVTDPRACDLEGLAAAAETAATSGGFSPAAYDALIVNAPDLYCGAGGYGEIGGRHTWVQNGL